MSLHPDTVTALNQVVGSVKPDVPAPAVGPQGKYPSMIQNLAVRLYNHQQARPAQPAHVVQPPHGDAAGGYSGIGTGYDSYGNRTSGQTVESFHPPGQSHGLYTHVMGGHNGPAGRSMHGVTR